MKKEVGKIDRICWHRLFMFWIGLCYQKMDYPKNENWRKKGNC